MAIVHTQSVLLLHYNNYFNRIVKKLDTIAAYKGADASYAECENINFVPSDGINTSLVLGYGSNPGTTFDSGANYDYLVVEDVADDTEEHTITRTINSRWFILEAHRTRDKQYEIILRRDVIADNYENVLNSPTYIEKATITDENDPLIFNSEGLLVNQIKDTETPLKDETQCGWVVGYIPSDWQGAQGITSDVVVDSGSADITVQDITQWAYWKNVRNNPSFKYMSSAYGNNTINLKVGWIGEEPQSGIDSYKYWMGSVLHFTTADYINSTNEKTFYTSNYHSPDPSWWPEYPVRFGRWLTWETYIPASDAKELTDRFANETMKNYVNAYIGGGGSIEIASQSDINDLLALRSKIVKDTQTNSYYRIDIVEISADNPLEVTNTTTAGQNLINYANVQVAASSKWSGTVQNGTMSVQLSSASYAIDLVQISIKCQVDITTDRYHLSDNPYDMFCIPYSSDISISTGINGITFKCVKEVALNMAEKLAAQAALSANKVYDIQLLPYCPARHIVAGSPSPSAILDVSKGKYNIINNIQDGQDPVPVSCIIWCMSSSFLVPIDYSLDIERDVELALINPNVQQGSYLNTNVPLCITNINPSFQAQFNPDQMNMSCVPSTVNNMNVKYVDKQTYAVIDEWQASKVTLDWYNDDTTMNVLSLVRTAYPTRTDSYTVAAFNSLPYYIIIEFKNVDVGAKGTAHGWPWALGCKYADIHYKNPKAVDLKLANETELYRLCSPNYNGFFEFSVAKSYGINGFMAECTYKPWNPYIHVTPKLKGLYGVNYTSIDDSRGLICGGDFSLPQLDSAWATYEMQNKNYQNIFDRQMQNMDVNFDIAKQQSLMSAIAGTFTGGISGGVSGALAGAKAGPYGALAGAAIGGTLGTAAGAIGGAIDYKNLERLQSENRSFATDMYNYNLQNIQAIPNSLTKSSALTFNTRIWPFVEHYECTQKEKDAFTDKLRYNGMTVMKIGKIADYKLSGELSYIKGQVIRLGTVNGESALASEIYNEINKGVYI